MPTVNNFEDLRVWKTSREIVNEIYSITKKAPFAKDFALIDQIRRAAISIMSNIAEGFESASDKKFVNYVNIAKASAGECRAQVYISIDQGYISQQEGKELVDKLISVSKQLSKLETYLRNDNSDRVNETEIKYE